MEKPISVKHQLLIALMEHPYKNPCALVGSETMAELEAEFKDQPMIPVNNPHLGKNWNQPQMLYNGFEIYGHWARLSGWIIGSREEILKIVHACTNQALQEWTRNQELQSPYLRDPRTL